MNRALYALGFVAATAFWPGIVDAATAPRWAALAVMVPLCLILLNPSSLSRHLPVFAAALIPLCAAAFSIAWSPDPLGGLDELVRMAILASAFVLGASIKDLDRVWGGLAVGVAVSAILAVAQLAGFDAIPQAVSPAGLFGNKNLLAEAGLVSLIVAPTALLAIAAMLAIALGTSKAVFGAVALVGAVLLMPRRPRVAKSILAVIAIAAVAAFGAGMPSAMIRAGYWGETLGAMTALGHGLGSFAIFNPEAEFAHSELLQALFEQGLLVLPMLAVITYALGGAHVGGSKLERDRLVLAGVCAVGFFSFPFHMPLTAFAAALAGGHLVAARLRVREHQHARAAAYGIGV